MAERDVFAALAMALRTARPRDRGRVVETLSERAVWRLCGHIDDLLRQARGVTSAPGSTGVPWQAEHDPRRALSQLLAGASDEELDGAIAIVRRALATSSAGWTHG